MLKDKIYLEITENITIFEVGKSGIQDAESSDHERWRLLTNGHEKTLTPIESKRLKNNNLIP